MPNKMLLFVIILVVLPFSVESSRSDEVNAMNLIEDNANVVARRLEKTVPSRIPTMSPTKKRRTPSRNPSPSPARYPSSSPTSAVFRTINSDPYSAKGSDHATQVEPDSFSFGSMVVAAVQSGRYYDGGCDNICWSTSKDGGKTWPYTGCLPGITVVAGGTYERVSVPAVAYDAKHDVWLIVGLPFFVSPDKSAISVSRSTDGGLTWTKPVFASVATAKQSYDKPWIVCDNTATSPYYGNCYLQWDDDGYDGRIQLTTSSNGGLTWGKVKTTSNRGTGLAGQPLVTPSGMVIIPSADYDITKIIAFRSVDGGSTWSSSVTVATIGIYKTAGGSLRSLSIPSAEIDGSGKVYVSWADCRFRKGCSSNDVVYSTSIDGITWTAVTRVPIDATSSTVDHVLPGLAVNKDTKGTNTELALTYYYFPKASCTYSTCSMYVGFISSTNGGRTWSSPKTLAGPMSLSWLPSTSLGYMVADYISTSFSNGRAVPIFAAGYAPSGGGKKYHLAMSTSLAPITV